MVFRRDPNRGFRVWSQHEVYIGELGVTTGTLYIPNVNDLVVNPNGIIYQVKEVDEASGLPTLEVINGKDANSGITDPDSLPEGLRNYQPHGINRIFIDTSVSPSIISVDSRYRIYGSETTQAKLFKGTDISTSGEVISHTLNSSGVVVSEMIALVPLFDGNTTIKRPARFHTTAELADGELVTLVIYNASGRVSGTHPFIVRNANTISGPTASNIYIVDVELVGDLISDENPLLIENPLHVPFQTNMLFARIHYSNGDYADHAIDGNKIKLHGVSGFNTSIIGPSSNVVLSYYPDSTEPAINLQGSIHPSISKTYRLTNIMASTDLALKLYVIPVWTGSGYVLKFRLTDLEYLANLDVTDLVTVSRSDGTAFRGNDYGREQTVNVYLDLSRINPNQNPPHTHVQQFKITLNAPGGLSVDNYVIDYGGDGMTYFGAGHYATASLTYTHKFKLDINQTSLEDWKSWLYRTLDPIFDNSVDTEAPEPTHFRLEHGGVNGGRLIGTYDISQWDDEFELGTEREWEQGYPLVVTFIVRVSGTDKILGVAPLAIKYIYSGS
jgi:hypothetical protein